MPLTVTTAPTVEPLSTAEAKTHLRVDHANDDTYIASLVAAARVDTETATRRTLVNTTYTLTLDAFPGYQDYIELPAPPLSSVTSVYYIDQDGVSTLWANTNYTVVTSGLPGSISLAYGKSWPNVRSQRDAITIVYVGGYGATASTVPEMVRHSVRLKVAHWYENREAVMVGVSSADLPIGIKRLDSLNAFRGTLNIYEDGLTQP